MAQAVQVQCVNKSNRYSPHERIHAIGGRNPDGSRWKLSQDQAILSMKQGRYSFYVELPPGRRVPVVIARTSLGHEYLRTISDGDQADNLLSLPECV